MPTQDEEFIKKLRATFKVEAEEHLQAISTMLLEVEKSPSSDPPTAAIENIYRAAHSLKGAARAVDLSGIEAICQALESVFSAWKRQQISPSPEAFDTLHNALDTIRTFLASPESEHGAGSERPRNELIQRLNRLHAPKRPEGGHDLAHAEAPRTEAPPVKPTPTRPVETEKAVVDETVRVSIARLDSRLLQAEEMLMTKALVAARAAELREVAGLFEQWRKEWAKVSGGARVLRLGLQDKSDVRGQSVPVSSTLLNFLDWNGDYLRSLEHKMTSLAARAEQDRRSVAKQVDELLEDSKKLLMLPFATLAPVFPRLVRDLCRDQGKDAELVIQGGEVEIDKRILEEMKDALIHILRNCVDHGVEQLAERQRLGKPPRATITIAVSRADDNKVEIRVSDDGAGIDLEKVKASAVRHGALSETEARTLGNTEAMALIFRSDVSTSPVVTAISGRGLGMTIVREKTEKLGGRISIESKPSVGTTLRILLPLTLATFRGILVTAADRTFVVPTLNVERVLRVKPQDVHTVENRETVSIEGRAVSLARLDRLLELPPKRKADDDSTPMPVLVIHSSDERVAFAVDEVLHEEEVLIKPLRKPLVRVRNVAGATVLGSGRAVPVLNITDLVKSARTQSVAAPPARESVEEPKAPRKKVLVVEDSITSRMLLKGILESVGYQVKVAVDGIDGYMQLREDRFDLVVSDVEMPRMNGFGLTEKIRADKRLADLPVVLVTALESREQRERGVDAGASAYIIKSSFDQSNLLEVIRKLI